MTVPTKAQKQDRHSWLWIALIAGTLSGFSLLRAAAQPQPTIEPTEVSFAGLVSPQQQPGKSAYHIETWATERGLPRAGVTALAQDHDGFLWLGLERGIARFDGERFVYFSPDTTPGLVDNRIQALYSDRKGRLWIGAQASGSSLRVNGEFSRIRETRNGIQSSVNAFAETPKGIMLRASDLGLELIDEHLQAKAAYDNPSSYGTAYRIVTTAPHGEVFTSSWEIAGRLEGRELVPLTEVSTNRILTSNNLFPGKDHRVWLLSALATEYGALHRLLPNGQFTKTQLWPFPVPVYKIGAFLEDSQENLWLSVLDDAVYRVGVDGVYERFAIGQGRIVALFEDRQESIWAGSETAGLFRLTRPPFQTHPTPQPAPVESITIADRSAVYFTQNNRVHFADTTEVRSIELNASYGVFHDSKNRLWTSTPGALSIYQRQGIRFEWLNGFAGPDYPAIQTFFESANQEVWVGRGNGGLVRFQNGSPHTLADSESAVVSAMENGPDGALWIGCLDGRLLQKIGDKLTAPADIPRFTSRKISHLHKDEDGSLWISTLGDGLFHWNHHTLFRHTKDAGLPTNEICSIQGTETHLWIATTKGIARVPRIELQNREAGLQPTVQCLTFGKPDGLPATECSSIYATSSARTDDGRLWFATTQGLVSINPETLSATTSSPPVFIERVQADEQNLEISQDGVTIPAGSNRITFHYTGITLASPHQARFQFRLQGAETDWIDAWKRRDGQYTRLAPGSYRFEVRAANNNGGWSKQPAGLRVVVEPFYWQTRTFKVVAASIATILIGVIAWLMTRGIYVGRIKAMERAQAVERERSRIAADLHDRLGAQTTQIIFQAGALTQQMDGGNYKAADQSADLIGDTAQDLALSVDEIVWATNPSRDNSESSIAFITSYAESYFRKTNTRLRIDVPPGLERTQLSAEIRHQVFLASKEAMTNVIKHAAAKTVWLRFEQTEHRFVITIEDDGKGFIDRKESRLRHGLAGMQNRIEAVGGTVTIAGKPYAGVKVSLAVPFR